MIININNKECDMNTKILFKANPKRVGSKSYARYEVYSKAKDLKEYFDICTENKFNRYLYER